MNDLMMQAAIDAFGIDAVIRYWLGVAEEAEARMERQAYPEYYSGDAGQEDLWHECWMYGQAPTTPRTWAWREDSVDHIDNINMGDLDSVIFDDEFDWEIDPETGDVILPLEGLPIEMDDDGEWVAL